MDAFDPRGFDPYAMGGDPMMDPTIQALMLKMAQAQGKYNPMAPPPLPPGYAPQQRQPVIESVLRAILQPMTDPLSGDFSNLALKPGVLPTMPSMNLQAQPPLPNDPKAYMEALTAAQLDARRQPPIRQPVQPPVNVAQRFQPRDRQTLPPAPLTGPMDPNVMQFAARTSGATPPTAGVMPAGPGGVDPIAGPAPAAGPGIATVRPPRTGGGPAPFIAETAPPPGEDRGTTTMTGTGETAPDVNDGTDPATAESFTDTGYRGDPNLALLRFGAATLAASGQGLGPALGAGALAAIHGYSEDRDYYADQAKDARTEAREDRALDLETWKVQTDAQQAALDLQATIDYNTQRLEDRELDRQSREAIAEENRQLQWQLGQITAGNTAVLNQIRLDQAQLAHITEQRNLDNDAATYRENLIEAASALTGQVAPERMAEIDAEVAKAFPNSTLARTSAGPDRQMYIDAAKLAIGDGTTTAEQAVQILADQGITVDLSELQ